jgi:hypothetical protein
VPKEPLARHPPRCHSERSEESLRRPLPNTVITRSPRRPSDLLFVCLGVLLKPREGRKKLAQGASPGNEIRTRNPTLLPQAVALAAKLYQQDELSPLNKVIGFMPQAVAASCKQLTAEQAESAAQH